MYQDRSFPGMGRIDSEENKRRGEARRQDLVDRGMVRDRSQQLKRLPRTVLLEIAIELDSDVVAEKFEEGWTKQDIIRTVESLLGNLSAQGPIRDVQVIDSTIDEGYAE